MDTKPEGVISTMDESVTTPDPPTSSTVSTCPFAQLPQKTVFSPKLEWVETLQDCSCKPTCQRVILVRDDKSRSVLRILLYSPDNEKYSVIGDKTNQLLRSWDEKKVWLIQQSEFFENGPISKLMESGAVNMETFPTKVCIGLYKLLKQLSSSSSLSYKNLTLSKLFYDTHLRIPDCTSRTYTADEKDSHKALILNVAQQLLAKSSHLSKDPSRFRDLIDELSTCTWSQLPRALDLHLVGLETEALHSVYLKGVGYTLGKCVGATTSASVMFATETKERETKAPVPELAPRKKTAEAPPAQDTKVTEEGAPLEKDIQVMEHSLEKIVQETQPRLKKPKVTKSNIKPLVIKIIKANDSAGRENILRGATIGTKFVGVDQLAGVYKIFERKTQPTAEDSEQEDKYYIYQVMDFLPGVTLGRAIEDAKTQFPQDLIVCWLLDITGGLEVMHNKNYVHCDLKPANIMVCGQSCTIIDFSIAAKVNETSSVGLLAPDQCGDQHGYLVTPAVDIYAFGLILHFIMTREKWTRAESLQVMLERVKKLYSAYDAELHSLLASCLNNSPALRRSAKEIAGILKALQKKTA